MGVESSGGRWWGGADEVVVVVGRCIRKCEVGEGAEGPKPKIEPLGRDFRCTVRNGVDSSEGRWCKGVDEGVVVVGHCIRKCKAGEGVWAKRLKPSYCGLISGAPCEMAKGDGVEGWCGGAYEVAVAVGLCTRKMQGREGVWAKI
jgi:hypothetical protein